MGRFATREDEVDDLFRRGVFVDLYRVVRQGVRAGVESYSIKRLEPLCGYTRQMDLRQATEQPDRVRGRAGGRHRPGRRGDETRSSPATTRTTAGPRWRCGTGWSSCGAELAGRLGEDLPRPAAVEEPESTEDPEVTRIRARAAGGPARGCAGADRGAEGARPCWLTCSTGTGATPSRSWWRYFYVRTLSAAELIGEPDALGGLTGGEVVGQVKQSVVRRFSFPPQEYRFKRGDCAVDPVRGRGWPVVGRGRRARDHRPEGRAGLCRPLARGAGRGQPGQHQGAGGTAPRPRRPGRARGRDRTGRRDRAPAAAAPRRRWRPGGAAARRRRSGDGRGGPARAGSTRLLPADPGTTRNREDVHRRPGRSSSSSRRAAPSGSPALPTPSSTT